MKPNLIDGIGNLAMRPPTVPMRTHKSPFDDSNRSVKVTHDLLFGDKLSTAK